MSDPHSVRNITATIKGDGRDAPWIVFHGTVEGVKEQIAEARANGLFDLVNEVTAEFKAVGTVVQKLGGKVVNEGGEAKSAPSEDEHLLGLIAAASNTAELMDIWTRYQDKFKEGTPLFDAMGKRSAELG